MATLTDEIKEFIVKSLARYDTPTQVTDAVKARFDLQITRWQVHAYDPACSRPPAQRWQDLHAAARQAYLREVAEIGVSQKAVRLAMLDRMARHSMERHAFEQAAEFLEQAARECGGMYENRRRVMLQLSTPDPGVPQASVAPAHHPIGSAAAETRNTISAAATIVSIGSEGAALSPPSGPLPVRNSSATCSEA